MTSARDDAAEDFAILRRLVVRPDFVEIVALARVLVHVEAEGLHALARVALVELGTRASTLDGEFVSSRRIVLALGRSGWIAVGQTTLEPWRL